MKQSDVRGKTRNAGAALRLLAAVFVLTGVLLAAASPACADYTAVAAGTSHSLGLKSDGTVWAWGYNNKGQLGDGTAITRYTPVQVSGLSGVTAIAARYIHSLALKNDGTVWAWGYNYVGQLGDGTTTDRYTPVQVSGLSGVTAIATGDGGHSLAVKTDGTVWAWGNNDDGQLGDGTTTVRYTPVQVSGLSGVTAVAAGDSHSLARKNDGTMWAWGSNWHGQLGDGTNENDRYTPVQVSGLSGVTAVAAGEYHSLARKSNGTVWAWGYNYYGQIGDGTTTHSSTPVQVSSGANSVAAGYNHSLAVKTDGTVWAWGRYNTYTPVQVSGLSGVTAIAAGAAYSLAVKGDGTAWAWGNNVNGQLGDGTTTGSTTPVEVSGQASGVNFTSPTVDSLTVNWTRGGRASCIVLMRESGAVDSDPANTVTYTADAAFGTPGSEVGTGNYAVYQGTGTSVTVTGLTANTVYHVAVYEFDGSGGTEDYLTPGALGSRSTLGAEPVTQASGVNFSLPTQTSLTLNWTRGTGGDSCIVVMKLGSAVDADPADGTVYTANAAFGSGTQIGTGNRVVYKGTGTTVTVTGLTANTVYYAAVYEYSGTGGTENYKIPGVSGSRSTLVTEPATQASSVSLASPTETSVTVNWSRGNGSAGCIVLMKAGASVDADPEDGTDSATYSANTAFGSGTQIGTGNYVIYKGTGTSVPVTWLTANTVYYVKVYEYSGTGGTENYKTPGASGSRSTLVSEPGTQASSVSFASPTDTSMTVSWTRGDGANCIVLMKAGTAVNTDPADGTDSTTYTANPAFGSGTQIGTGNRVVYKGTGTSVTVTGLTANTVYHVAVYEYSGTGGLENYKTPGEAGNKSTLFAEPGMPASPARMVSSVSDTMTLNWANGNGTSRLVLMREGNAVDANPADGMTYTANAAFGSGDEIGTGNFVVCNGAGTSVTVTGLTAGTMYYIAVYEYNGSGGTENYDAGAAFSGNTAMPAPGKAISFDGTDDIADIGDLDFLDGASQYTLEARISPQAFSTWKTAFGKRTSDSDRALVLQFYDTSGNIGTGVGTGYGRTSSPPLSLNTWHHIAIVYNGGGASNSDRLKLYADGTPLALTFSGTVPAVTPAGSSSRFVIGAEYNLTTPVSGTAGVNAPFSGQIDEVRIWNTARTPDQIRANMNRTVDPGSANLVVYYRSDQLSGSVLYDLTSNNNDGTLVSSPAWSDSAAFTVWTGDTDTGWSTAGNWTDGVPTAASNVHIPSGGNQPEISAAAACNHLTLDAGAILSISAGQLDVKGNIFNSGTVSGAGTLVCSGTSAQTLNSASFENLTVNNAAGVTTETALSISGTLTLTAGTLTLGGNLTVNNGTLNLADGDIIPDGNTVSYSGTTALEYSGAGPYTAADTEFPAASGPANLTVNSAGGLTLHADRTVSDLTLTNGALSIGANTLILNGGLAATSGTLTGGDTSALIIGGTGDIELPGTALTLSSLTLNRPGAVITLGNGLTVKDTLTLTAGILNIGAYHLILDENAAVAGSPSVSAMILADSTGEMRKIFADDVTLPVSFTFPVGSDSGTPEYSPVTAEFTAGTFVSAYAGVKLADSQYPVNDSPDDYIERYWTLSQSGITGFSCDLAFSYPPADIQGTESGIRGKYYDGSEWTDLSQAGGNQFTGTVTAFGDFTGADHTPSAASPLLDITVNEDAPPASEDLSAVFSDFDDDDVLIEKTLESNSNPGLVSAEVSGDTLTLTLTPDGNGTADIVIRGTINDKYAEDEITVTVNPVDDAPTAGTIADVTADEDSADTLIDLSGVFSDIDSDISAIAKSIAANDSPELVSASVSGNTLTLSYLPDQNGTAEITVRGTVDGKSADTAFAVAVNPVDDAPIIGVPLFDLTLKEDTAPMPISLTQVFADIDSDIAAIVKSVVSNTNPGVVSAEIDGDTLTLTCQKNQHGTADIVIQGLSDGQTVTHGFTVTITPEDDPPEPVADLPDIQVSDGDAPTVLNLSELFTDADNDPAGITFAATSSNASFAAVSLDGNMLTLSFPEDRTGTAVITVTATSGGKTASYTFEVTVGPQTFAVSGRTPYYSNNLPVPGTVLTLKGTNFYTGGRETFAVRTGTDGAYIFEAVPRGEYILTPSKTEDPGPAGLSSDDASKIGDFALRRHTLTEEEIKLADVTGNGTVSATDASRLGRYVGGLIPAMNYTGEYWRFSPASAEILLDADFENQDFTVTRIGDMSGNWTPGGVKRSPRDTAHLTKITAEPGEVLSVPVIFSEPAEIRGVDIAAEFDGNVLKPGEITLAGGILEGGQYELIVNTNEPGRIRIVLFAPSVYAFTGTGTFLTLNFDVTGSYGSGTLLTLTQFDCNEIPVSDGTGAYRAAESVTGGFSMNGEVSHALGIGIGTEYAPAVYDPAAYDANGDGRTDVSDAVFALREGNPAAVIRVLQYLTGIPNQGISK